MAVRRHMTPSRPPVRISMQLQARLREPGAFCCADERTGGWRTSAKDRTSRARRRRPAWTCAKNRTYRARRRRPAQTCAKDRTSRARRPRPAGTCAKDRTNRARRPRPARTCAKDRTSPNSKAANPRHAHTSKGGLTDALVFLHLILPSTNRRHACEEPELMEAAIVRRRNMR